MVMNRITKNGMRNILNRL